MCHSTWTLLTSDKIFLKLEKDWGTVNMNMMNIYNWNAKLKVFESECNWSWPLDDSNDLESVVLRVLKAQAWPQTASIDSGDRSRPGLKAFRPKSFAKPERCAFKKQKLNRMKPTNPNADTFVEGERQYLSHVLPDIVVGHPDMTRWFDSLVGHSCLTLLRNTLARHFYLTRLFDTLTWHSCRALLLDTFVDTLTWHAFLALLHDTFVRYSDLTHFLDTLVVTLFLDTLAGHSYLTLLWNTLTWHFLYDTLTWHTCWTLLLDTFVRHSYITPLRLPETWSKGLSLKVCGSRFLQTGEEGSRCSPRACTSRKARWQHVWSAEINTNLKKIQYDPVIIWDVQIATASCPWSFQGSVWYISDKYWGWEWVRSLCFWTVL